MGSTKIVLYAALLLGVFRSTLGLPQLERTAKDPARASLQNVSLHHLSSEYLQRTFSDVSLLRIANCEIGKIQKDAFDHLSHLNLLEISDSEIKEPIDQQTFLRLPALEILVLQNVGLRRFDLKLTNVQELILSKNKIEAVEVTGKEVTFLDLSDNRLESVAVNFANLSKLSLVDLSRNEIAQVPPVFENNVNLRMILATENKITSTDGLKLPWLKTLNLFDNKIKVLTPDSFSNMASLEMLLLAFNEIKTLDNPFGDLAELRHLTLDWNQIEELKPDLFVRTPYLTKLTLQGNKLGTLERLQGEFYHLAHLDLSHNQLSAIDESFFLSTPSLQFLDLSFNRLKTVREILSPLPELKILNLAYNDIALSGNELSANVQLRRLNLSYNALEGGIAHFESNSILVDLDLSGNEISDFCHGNFTLDSLLKLNLRKNNIKSLKCLNDFGALCEVDLRNNPLACGDELNALMLFLANKKSSPRTLTPEFQPDLLYNQCENLSLNRSINLWNSVQQELCPGEPEIKLEIVEKNNEWTSEEETETENVEEKEGEEDIGPQKLTEMKTYIIRPIGWITNDQMNKPNPLEGPQSGRQSWGSIEQNSELIKGFEDEDVEKRPRFSWYTIAFILIGLSLTLTCFNLVVFLYIRLKLWKRADAGSSQKYTFLHNEVYKNTTEPSIAQTGDRENERRNKMFSYGKLNEVLLNFALHKKDKDSESAKNVLIGSPSC